MCEVRHRGGRGENTPQKQQRFAGTMYSHSLRRKYSSPCAGPIIKAINITGDLQLLTYLI